MRNLAGTGDTAAARAELAAAGIDIIDGPVYGECKVFVFGLVGRWLITRSWYYWVAQAAEGHELPSRAAEDFDRSWGSQVRAHGYGGGGALGIRDTVDSFHIDSQAGLEAFAAFIREVQHGR
jgi:hypothetical protein